MTRHRRRYAETGHGAEPFILEELSPRAPCHDYTSGIVGRGPGFVIPLVPQHQDDSLSCPGRVVRGKETLDRLNSIVLVVESKGGVGGAVIVIVIKAAHILTICYSS
jgi:hypothetical protein